MPDFRWWGSEGRESHLENGDRRPGTVVPTLHQFHHSRCTSRALDPRGPGPRRLRRSCGRESARTCGRQAHWEVGEPPRNGRSELDEPALSGLSSKAAGVHRQYRRVQPLTRNAQPPRWVGRANAEGAIGNEHDILPDVPPEPDDIDRLESRLLKKIARASHDHLLIEPGDKIMVAVSGGKDSHVLLHLLELIRRRAPFKFSLIALNVDQCQPGFPKDLLPNYFAERGYDFRIVTEDTYSVVKEKIPEGKTTCSLCSRLRRGILYTRATQLEVTKIALGHHRDDFIETLLLNLLYSGQIKAMPARLQSDDGRHVVIRPLVYCAESEIAHYARAKAFPIIPCSLCGSQPNLQRQRVKELIANLSLENASVPNSLMAALENVRPSQLLDRNLLARLGGPDPAPPVQELPETNFEHELISVENLIASANQAGLRG